MLRDSDLALTIFKPMQNGKIVIEVEINGQKFTPEERHFVVKVDKSRYSATGAPILLEMIGGARMQEIMY